MDHLLNIVSQFSTTCQVNSIVPFGSGHIHDTFLVTTHPVSFPDYILQRINHLIFSNIQRLTDNMLKITNHIKEGLSQKAGKYQGFQVFQLTACNSGDYYYTDSMGNYWRLIEFISSSKSFDKVDSPVIAFEAGKAFAIFQELTSDFDINGLFEVLPNFHNISSRLENFRSAVLLNPANRINTLTEEIAFVETRAEEMHTILRLVEKGKIPLRVTHNDTKINNVLFNEQNQAIAVIDLDTVMPGSVLYDFGDAIRTGASTGAEDEAELGKIHIDLPLFEAYSKGYLRIAGDFLTITEIENLAFSAKFMTYIIGLRFLTDHINGDTYFKISFPGHNLQRARAQFRLLQSMEDHFHEMTGIISEVEKTRLN
jgi:hypothetical protein